MRNSINWIGLLLLLVNPVAAQTGGTWTDQYSGTSNFLFGVSAVSDDTAFVCGAGGAFLKTTNGGALWTSVSSGSAQDYYAIDFINGTTGFVVGNNGTIRKTSNAGLNWTPSSVGFAHLRSVLFRDTSTVLVGGAGGLIAKSVDGGANWTNCSSGTSSTVYDIFFISPLTGYATCYDGSVLITQDGGDNWVPHATGVTTKLNQIHFLDPLNGILIGEVGVIRRTTDGGLSWSAVSMPTIADDLGGLAFLDPLHGFASGALPSVSGEILETTDGGLSWDTIYSGITPLTGMDFANPNTGYVTGYNGKILKYTDVTGLTENTAEGNDKLKLFPNPVSQGLRLSLRVKSNENLKMEVYDICGELVEVIFEGFVEANYLNVDADVSHYASGLYFLKCSGSLSETRKFVKY